MNVWRFFERLKKFFREDAGAVIGAYFDGEKLFVVQLTEKFETVEVEAEGAELEQVTKQIAQVCKRKDWSTAAVGFCLRAEDAVTFQSEIGNVPPKEIPALVKSWAVAQAGAGAVYSSAQIGEELWMETLPRVKVEEFNAAFKKFGLNLRGLSVMPADVPTLHPFERTEFISEVVRNKKAPNLLAGHSVWDWRKISAAVAAIFCGVLIIASTKIFFDYRAASEALDAAKVTVEQLREDVALKKTIDAEVAALRRFNELSAQVPAPQSFNHLLKLGKVAGTGIRLTGIELDEKTLELEGLAIKSDAVKSYLARVKNSVANSARLANSEEQDDGEIAFTIRAAF